MSSMINLKASRKTPTINISTNPVTNVHVTNRSAEHPTMVQYPPVEQPNPEFVSVSPQTAMSTFTTTPIEETDPGSVEGEPRLRPEKAKLLRENAVLKLIIDIQHNNPLIVNKYIIADDETLMKMVALLCNASEVNIDADDLGRGCLSKKIYRKVHSIYVVVNGETKNLKYDFSDVMKTLKDLHISVKYVW